MLFITLNLLAAPAGSGAFPGRTVRPTDQPALTAASASLTLSVANNTSLGLSTPKQRAISLKLADSTCENRSQCVPFFTHRMFLLTGDFDCYQLPRAGATIVKGESKWATKSASTVGHLAANKWPNMWKTRCTKSKAFVHVGSLFMLQFSQQTPFRKLYFGLGEGLSYDSAAQ
jgi:hypothetical protein